MRQRVRASWRRAGRVEAGQLDDYDTTRSAVTSTRRAMACRVNELIFPAGSRGRRRRRAAAPRELQSCARLRPPAITGSCGRTARRHTAYSSTAISRWLVVIAVGFATRKRSLRELARA